MQEYTFIPKVQMTAQEFWAEATELAKKKKMGQNLSIHVSYARKGEKVKNLSFGEKILWHSGEILNFSRRRNVVSRIDAFAKTLNVELEHYIISSGLYEIIGRLENHETFSRKSLPRIFI